MKNKWVFSIIIALGILLFANSYYKLEYNMSLAQYFLTDEWLTSEERSFLATHGDLIYGSDQNAPPLRYVNEETGQYEGLVIDYIAALSMELGVNIQTRPMIWNDALEAVEKGETDFCDMYASKERTKRFLFTDPIYYQRGAILVKRGDLGIQKKEDLEGKKVAANQGDYVQEFLGEQYQAVEVLATNDLRIAITALEEGKVQAVLGDESVLNYYLTRENLSGDYVILDTYLYERPAALGVDKNNQEMVNILNKAIYRLNKQNTMERIYDKWFGGQPLITRGNTQEKFLLIFKFTLAVGLLSGLVLYYWNRQLKREVTRQTLALKQSHDDLERTFQEYKMAEKQMMQSRKMAAVGQLAAGIAHEIRTPLGIIRNTGYLLKRKWAEEEALKQLEIIDQSVSRANGIIDNLLNFSRISDNRIEKVDLERFINGLWRLNEKAWDTQGINFVLICESPVLIDVYSEGLKHVLLNLFSNGVDAMAEGGLLEVQVIAKTQSSPCKLVIKDSGNGMSEETLEQLYDPFFTTKPIGKGTGLGLYIVYNEIQKMGAQILIESKLGEGSQFTITLPDTQIFQTSDGKPKGEAL